MRRFFFLLPLAGASLLYACANSSNDNDLDDPLGGAGGVSAGSSGKAGISGAAGAAGKGTGGIASEGGQGGATAGTAGTAGAAGALAGTAGTGGATVEDTNELCSDGLDNDNNEYADCADLNCVSNPDVTVCAGVGGSSGAGGSESFGGNNGGGEDTNELCTDGQDNDGDKFVDCEDKDCCGVVDCKSVKPTSYCAKQGSGGSAGSSSGTEDTGDLCTDKKDNDGDKFVDCNDKGCCSVVDCSDQPTSYCAKQGSAGSAGSAGGTKENTAALCTDNKDNDGDKFVDCDDFECCDLVDCEQIDPTSSCGKKGTGGSAGSSGGEDTVALCTDKKDNDGDKFVDCEDKGCCALVDCKSVKPTSYCAKQGSAGSAGSAGGEATVALCTDKKDNDGDKYIDCEDKNCCSVVDCSDQPTSYCAKQGSAGSAGSAGGTKENTLALCTDNKDNDGDKFVDCDDFDCCDVASCKTTKPDSTCATK